MRRRRLAVAATAAAAVLTAAEMVAVAAVWRAIEEAFAAPLPPPAPLRLPAPDLAALRMQDRAEAALAFSVLSPRTKLGVILP